MRGVLRILVLGAMVVPAFVLLVGVAVADTVTVISTRDAECASRVGGDYAASTNWGWNPHLTANPIYEYTPDDHSYGVIQFDLSAIPAGSLITSATLNLFQVNNAPATSSAGEVVSLYTNAAPWSELRVTYDNWIAHGYASHVAPTVVGTATLDGDISVWRMWDITGIVQQWVDGTVPNYGLTTSDLISGYWTGSGRHRVWHRLSASFYGREAAGYGPHLVVTYSPPETANGATPAQ